MAYQRVLPRDLFNEAKLLKCMGALMLLITDEMVPWIEYDFYGEYEHAGFDIGQYLSDGNLYIANMSFRLKATDSLIFFSSAYNSKNNYPLWCNVGDNIFTVFDEDGNFMLNEQELLEASRG